MCEPRSRGGENFFSPPPAEIFGIYPPLPRVSPGGNFTPPKIFLDHYRGVEKFYPPLKRSKNSIYPPPKWPKNRFTPPKMGRKNFTPPKIFFSKFHPPILAENFTPLSWLPARTPMRKSVINLRLPGID